ncbi:MAG: hypothetical protein H8E14_13515 [Candidatus Marinimicrobia bacterium]|nr:hypothetical protein [Candidatus Neomarinimicrobiota bacterium]
MADQSDDRSTRDLVIQVLTLQGATDKKIDTLGKNLKERLDKQEKEDLRLHGRVSKANETIDEKILIVNNRIDKIRWWSIGSGGIGGFVGAFFAYFTGGKS